MSEEYRNMMDRIRAEAEADIEVIVAELKKKDMKIEMFSDELYSMKRFQTNHIGVHSKFGKLIGSKRVKIYKAGQEKLNELRDSGMSIKEAAAAAAAYKGELYREAHEKVVKRNLKKVAGLKPNMSEKEIECVLRHTTKAAYYCEETDTLYTCEHDGETAHSNPNHDEWQVYAGDEHVGTIRRNYCTSQNYTPHHGMTYSRDGGNIAWTFDFESDLHHPSPYPNMETFSVVWTDGGWGVAKQRSNTREIAGSMPIFGNCHALFPPHQFKTIRTAFKYFVEMDIVAVTHYQRCIVGGEE